jgi:hypothetical protein
MLKNFKYSINIKIVIYHNNAKFVKINKEFVLYVTIVKNNQYILYVDG